MVEQHQWTLEQLAKVSTKEKVKANTKEKEKEKATTTKEASKVKEKDTTTTTRKASPRARLDNHKQYHKRASLRVHPTRAKDIIQQAKEHATDAEAMDT